MSDAQLSNSPYAPGVAVQEDPGRTLGVVGLVLSVVANVIGLIVSIIAFRKSKQAGFNNMMAKVGIVIGAVTTGFGLLMGGIGIYAAVHLASTCSDLGPGVHQVGTTTVTCG